MSDKEEKGNSPEACLPAGRRSSAALRTIFLFRRRMPQFQPLAAGNDFEIGSRSMRPALPLQQLFSVILLFLVAFSVGIPVALGADPLTAKRLRMVGNDLRGRGIEDERVLDAMAKIERHQFVDRKIMERAYDDNPLPIDEGQTISQPYVVALMTEVLHPKKPDRVLEIGTGSGYQAAVLGEIVSEVYTIEIRKPLADKAEKLLKRLGYRNIRVKYGDGYYGWEEYAPFDAIIITAAANHIPSPLIKQLKEGGRLIIPLGSTLFSQTLTVATKKKGKIDIEQIESVRFVPMVGEVEKRR